MEKSFAVVGVLEELDKTLTVLENYLPRFFTGVRDIYNKNKAYWKSINRNNVRPKVDPGVRRAVASNMTVETEFYEYCKQRLHKQYLALGL